MRRLVVLLALAAATAAAQGDPVHLQLFSGVDREAVEARGLIEVEVEALAAPETAAAADALAEAFGAWDLGAQLGAGFEVVRQTEPMRRETDGVVEWQRRAIVRVAPGTAEVPALRLDVPVDGATVSRTTSARPLRTFAGFATARAAGRSVLAVTAEGWLDGVQFESIGSAFVVGGDALVTAYHVVVGARRVRVTLPDGRVVRLDRVWALDPVRDVAVLYLPPELRDEAGLAPLVVAPEAAPGRVAFTAGWPAGERRVTVATRHADLALDGQRLRVAGNVVRPGDSGGPLLDEAGRVLGVVVSGRATGDAPDLLREAICLASDPGPALAAYVAADGPVRLDRALEAMERDDVAGRALAAVGALQVPVRRRGADTRRYVTRVRDALLEAPDDPVLQYAGGLVMEEAGERDLAVTALDASRRAGYVPATYSLAHHHLEEGELELAATLFGELAREAGAEPYRRLALFGEAQALISLGRYTAAEEALGVVLDHDARFAPALYLLGVVRLAQGRPEEARALAVRLAPRPQWAAALRLPVETAALRPPVLHVLPRFLGR